ncbi:MAG: hypothetical protein SGPRY_005682 [Prymnesium sp.]
MTALLQLIVPLAAVLRPTQLIPRAQSAIKHHGQRVAPTMVAADVESSGARPHAFIGSTFGSNSAMLYRQGTLILEDGTRLRGVSFGYEESVAGELVFTTGMVGYPESLTDPSYKGQMLVMTYPIVGNYGVPDDTLDKYGLPEFFECAQPISPSLSQRMLRFFSPPHLPLEAPRSAVPQRSLSQWLTQQKVPALYGVDTRLLTKKIREKGSLKARIEFEPSVSSLEVESQDFVDPNKLNLVAEVSIKEPIVYGKGNKYKARTALPLKAGRP